MSDSAHPPVRAKRRTGFPRGDRTGAPAAMLGALATAAATLRVGDADLRVPFSYTWDGNATLLVVKGMIEHGSYLSIPNLGAPGGQELYDFPFETGNLNLLFIRLLGLFSRDPGLLVNLFYLITFPAVAGASYAVLRGWRRSIGVSVACSILFAVLPYHFLQLEHIFLAAYYPVPLGAGLVLAILGGRTLFTRGARAGGARPGWVSGRSLLTLATCIIVASGGLYYAAFTLFLVAGATLLAAAVHEGRRRTLITGSMVALLLAGGLAVNHAPSIAHTLAHGRNAEAGKRFPQESEWYSLGLAQLVLPMPQHRLEPLAALGLAYDTTGLVTAPKGTVVHLGAVASAGFLSLLGVAAAGILGAPRGRRGGLARGATAAGILAFLIGTTGGLGAVFAYLVTPQLRAWDRISVFIAFFSLVMVALALDRLRARFRGRRYGAAISAAGVWAILAVGLLDQTSGRFVPPYRETAAAYRSDRAFVAVIEQLLPPGAMVLQLPLQQFPEVTRFARMSDYDLLHPWIHSRHLRWSYGGIRGREPWADGQIGKPIPELLRSAAEAGFSGVCLDRFGYAEGSGSVERELEGRLGVTPLRSPDGRLLFYDLRPFKAGLGSAPAG